MAEQLEPGFTRVIHPGLGPDSVEVVPESSLPQLYLAGWTLLADDLPPESPLPPPRPVSREEVTGQSAAEQAGTAGAKPAKAASKE